MQVITYVAETKEKAERRSRSITSGFSSRTHLRTTPTFLAPPGYLSVDQLKKRAALADKLHGAFNFDNINEAFFVAVGTADQVVEQLEEWGEQMGTNHFIILGAHRQHAALEGGEESESDCAGRHPAHARARRVRNAAPPPNSSTGS